MCRGMNGFLSLDYSTSAVFPFEVYSFFSGTLGKSATSLQTNGGIYSYVSGISVVLEVKTVRLPQQSVGMVILPGVLFLTVMYSSASLDSVLRHCIG